ncbi:MAG: hypothetical protein LBL20_01070, partial [Treponema sp.]|nr:hypothetical protein [Treponema sp.]
FNITAIYLFNLGASVRQPARRAGAHGPGFPLVSFLPQAKKDTASIPCAAAFTAIMGRYWEKGPKPK